MGLTAVAGWMRALALDGSQQYRIAERVTQPPSLEGLVTAVTLTTHASPEHLCDEAVVGTARHWNGPMAVALFVPGGAGATVEDAAGWIAVAERCVPGFAAKATVAMVLPDDEGRHAGPGPEEAVAAARERLRGAEGGCAAAAAVLGLRAAGGGNYADAALPYPNNLLRNVARRMARGPWFLGLDADMVPLGPGLAAELAAELGAWGGASKRRALVLPAFELREGAALPLGRGEVVAAYNRTVRPFYFAACWKCQRHTGYDEWMRPGAGATYAATWHDPWEPFYAGAVEAVPEHDERFRAYGFNRISQVCEMHMAGFDWRVLRSGYVVHHGFKRPGAFHPTKEQEQERNRMLFRRFKEELKQRYPGRRRCHD